VSEDVPADVSAALAQLFEEGQQALEDGDRETCRQTVESAESVATNKLPEGELRGQLLHGCERVHHLLDPETEEDPEVAIEFLTAMQRRLPDEKE